VSRQPLHVIWPSLLDGGFVIDAAWREAKGGIVGTCECGAHLRAGPSYPAGRYRTGNSVRGPLLPYEADGVRRWICRVCFARVRRNASHVADPLPTFDQEGTP
jgi:hypothetical protein